MKKIGNRPITEADTDSSKLKQNQKKKEKKSEKSEKFPEKIFGKIFGFFFPFFFFTKFIFFSCKEVCVYYFYFMTLMNSMFIKHM